MFIKDTIIPDVKIVIPKRVGDHRGFFSETYSARVFAGAGINLQFVQDNHSLSTEVGVVRGLHFQTQPFAQDKLVRVTRGSIFDVAVDLRQGSPTYGQHVSVILSAEEGNQLLVPVGFAHGLMTLEPNTEVQYKVSNYYSPANDMGLMWNDPALGIAWPEQGQVIASEKDSKHPTLAELPTYFRY